ncbi:MAG: hypothetical protein IT428_11160 [Planctomycetaceae bacterium]|nr:hypothetical protein [Planctomycetaceae bacterium]
MTLWTRFGISVGIVMGTLGTTNAWADFESIDAWAKDAAADIVKEAANRNANAIFLDTLKADPALEGSSGSRLTTALEKALKTTNLTLSRQNYQFKIQGLILRGESAETKQVGAEVMLRFVDREDVELGRKNRFIFGESATHALLNTNISTPPGTDDRTRNAKLKENKPEVKVEGTKIRTTASSPYAVEIRIKKEGAYAPRGVEVGRESGRPFVEIHRDEVYAIRLYNDSDIEAAVHVTVDGLSVFEFSTIKEQPMYWIVPPKSHYDVLGWKITEELTDEFKSVEFPKSAAADKKLSHDEKIGVINTLFHASWEDDTKRPADEKGTKASGRGDRIIDKAEVVDRYIGAQRDSISIRYERQLPTP